MDTRNKKKLAVGGSAGVAVVVLLGLWLLSATRAESRAADLLSASADMARCLAGDDVQLQRDAIRLGFERRMVVELPDVSTARPCKLALDAVRQSFDAYDAVWFSSASSLDDQGKPLGNRIRELVQKLSEIPYETPSDRAFRKPDAHMALLSLADPVADLCKAAEQLYLAEGASKEQAAAAGAHRLREAPKTMAQGPVGRLGVSVEGRVNPASWELIARDDKRLTLNARTDGGTVVVAWSDDAGVSWRTATGLRSLFGKPEAEVRAVHAPENDRWLVVSHKEASEVVRSMVRVAPESATLPEPTVVPSAPEGWRIPRGAEREVIALAHGAVAFPVMRITDKTAAEKAEEDKQKKAREENYADPEVQKELMLVAARTEARRAQGIGEDEKRVDGVAYAEGGRSGPVLELDGWEIGAMLGGTQPMLLLGKQGMPALVLGLASIPAAGEALGQVSEALASKPVVPAMRGSHWYRCSGADGLHFGLSEQGTQLFAIRPGQLSLVHMTALADERSHMGCGADAAVVALPFEKDRIFANVVTIHAGEIEGARVAATAGTGVDEYNATVSTSAVPGAVVVAWAARGHVLAAISGNWGAEYRAPFLLANARVDGSRAVGVRLAGLGTRMVAVVQREREGTGGAWTTEFEVVVSDDSAQTWRAAGGGVEKRSPS